MKYRRLAALIFIFSLTLAGVLCLAQPAWVQPARIVQQSTVTPPDLFTSVEVDSGRGVSRLPNTVIRQRYVRANFALLNSGTRGGESLIRLNLFDDAAYTVTIERSVAPSGTSTRGGSDAVQFGRIADIPNSEVYLSSRGDVLAGNVRLPDGTLYQIRSVSPGVQVVQQINRAALPPDHPSGLFERVQQTNPPPPEPTRSLDRTPVDSRANLQQWGITDSDRTPLPSHPGISRSRSSATLPPGHFAAINSRSGYDSLRRPSQESSNRDRATSPDVTVKAGTLPQARTASDQAPTLNVMVVYTAAVLQQAGSEAALNSAIDVVEQETNQGYAQSGISHRIKIIQRRQVDYAETGKAETDLNRLLDPADGFLDEVHSLRQRANADTVSFWVTELDACGLGSLMRSPSFAFQNRAFNVVGYECATTNFSFAHELGHNLGATHDRTNAGDSSGSYPYSYGYQDPEGAFRTIMAYKDGCPGDCPRLNVWSNASYELNHKPLGNEQINNALTLENTWAIASTWKQPATQGGQCFAQQIYQTGNTFPQDWISRQGNQGYRVTHVAERDNQWAVVMSLPLASEQQAWIQSSSFPEDWMQDNLQHNQFITQFGSTKSDWMAIAAQPASYTHQEWSTGSRFPEIWINSIWQQGGAITEVGAKADEWAVVMSSPTGYAHQGFVMGAQFPKDAVQQGWKAGFPITSLGATQSEFAVVLSQPAGYREQTWATAESFPEAWVKQQQTEGFAITGLAATDQSWGVVMSKCD
ncbi:MAG TPA: M12 family metallo-peptidase [Coleofasciculaceae cyanobacterium]